MKERAPRLLDEALNVALRLEAWAKSINRPRQSNERLERSRQKVQVTAKPNASEIPVRPDFDDRMTQLEATMSQLQTNLQRLSEKATPATNVTVTSRAPVGIPLGRRQNTQTTVSAREVPHPFSRQWGNSKQPVHPNIPPLISSSSSQPFLCWKCGLPGHIKLNCPTNNQGVFGSNLFNNINNHETKKKQNKANVYIKVKLLGKEVPCLVDSGCDITFVPKTLTDRFVGLDIKPTSQHVWAANDTPIRISGEAQLPFVLNGKSLLTPVLISEDVEEVMLGIDWLEDHGCVWDFRSRKLMIDGQQTVTLSRRGHFKCQRVLTQKFHEIPPRSQQDIVARVTLLSMEKPLEDIAVDTHQLKPGVYVGRTLLPSNHRNVKVCIANTTNKSQPIPTDTWDMPYQ